MDRQLSAASATDRAFEVVDLKDFPLPMDGETDMPQTGRYGLETTRAWAARIAAAPAFVFVTPQYNGGYPAALKNAIDHVHAEWRDKPALIVTYGGRGGGHCGEQLAQVLRFVGAAPVETRPALILSRAHDRSQYRRDRPGGGVRGAPEEELRRGFAELAAALG